MIVDERYEALSDIGALIQEVHFSGIPEWNDLVSFLENRNIRVYLPLDKQVGMEELSDFSQSIYSAHFITDSISDSDSVSMYGNMRHLVLYCSSEESNFDQRDINAMQLAIVNLIELETFKFILVTQNEKLATQLSDRFIFPASKFKYEFVVKSKEMKFKK